MGSGIAFVHCRSLVVVSTNVDLGPWAMATTI
jgi:hypothetical protein